MSSATMDELRQWLRRAFTLDTVGQLLGWDEQVNLPAASADQRGEQQAAIAELQHAAAKAPRIGELLTALEGETLSADEAAVVKQARRDFDRATKLPVEFVREKAQQGSRGYHAWAEARAKADFGLYAAVLERNLDLARREAAYLGWAGREYDYMIDKHDPGLSAARIGALFAELKRELVPFAREVVAAARREPAGLAWRGFAVEAQQEFLREVTERLGFDYERGRIDVSLHPFCSGSGDDVRMTTRFKDDEPLDSLFSAIHETGHGLYEQGLTRADFGTALGMAAGMAAHESQSRLWENQVGRSRGFWRFFEPRWRERFPAQTAGVTSEALYRAINAVAPTLIRVDADEVTYNLHIVLRFEIERRLFDGSLAVRDLPAAWNAASAELIGLTPTSDRDGVLQDVHWSDGSFGYFPSYTLGNMMAAQLWYRALAERPALEADFARGEFGWLLQWLRTQVHAQGRRFDALELTQRVTGEELSPRALVRYLRERYG
ncbi:carboxypeptidase M32 [Horticoccus luteus]|uniref:Metal-dependent carboxypeptidase n=1 Tax=Horticoccus luteus TaxID=2862869 RepID=A0A8F9TVS4_9BACT|nr:carboxypeptidase M32 [Horticoccus luteus]QYM78482.1 carboxypeptidase M32 [Horticoccus luteus]